MPEDVTGGTSGGRTPEDESIVPEDERMIPIFVHVVMFDFWFRCRVRPSFFFDSVTWKVARAIWRSTGLYYKTTYFIMQGERNGAVFAYDRTIRDCMTELQANQLELQVHFHDHAHPCWNWDERRQPFSGGQTPVVLTEIPNQTAQPSFGGQNPLEPSQTASTERGRDRSRSPRGH